MSRNIKDMITNEAHNTNSDWLVVAQKYKENFIKEGLIKSAEHVDDLIRRFTK